MYFVPVEVPRARKVFRKCKFKVTKAGVSQTKWIRTTYWGTKRWTSMFLEGEPNAHKINLLAVVLKAFKTIYILAWAADELPPWMNPKCKWTIQLCCFWECTSKNVFVGHQSLTIATLNVVASFNNDTIVQTNILKFSGWKPGLSMVRLHEEVYHNERYLEQNCRTAQQRGKTSKMTAWKSEKDFDHDYQGGAC